MSALSGTSQFRVLFESALLDYERQTGTTLSKHPLADQLGDCNSVDSVLAILQEQARGFREFRGSDGRIMKSLKRAVPALYLLSTSALGEVVSTPFPPAKAIFAGFAILLAAVKDVGASYDALADLLESIEHFLNRLDIYTKVSPTRAMAEIIVKIMVELLSTLALVTKQIKQKRPMKFVKKLLGENDVEAVLQRLDRLTLDEARTTAAQTLEVVYGLVQNMRVVMDDGKASVDRVRDALEIMQQMASDMSKLKRDKLQKNIQSWLSPPDAWKNHNIARESHHTGTAAWFVQGDIFSEWKTSGPSSLLWIHGKPGAGKSVLCSTIIEDIKALQKSGLASLAFFYCDFREDQKKDQRGLLTSVLLQLCHQSDSYCDLLSDFYLEHASGVQHPSDDALIQCLMDLLKLPGHAPVYLIVDALDECPSTPAMPSPREKVLILVEGLVKSQLPNLRICVTSRPEIDIKTILDPLTYRSISLHDESGQMEDIDNYIRAVIITDPRNKRWKMEDKKMVIDALTINANGMFRWVYCQVVYLRGCIPGRIRSALSELPETLDETYERTLRDINEADWESAHRLFQCVAVASRPLHVEELAEFLAFDFKTGPIPKFHAGWRLDDPVDAVLSTCSTLLAIVKVEDEDSPIIQFSHFSVKEFLTSTRLAEKRDTISRRYHISATPAHTLVAQACLGILLHLDKDVTSDGLQEFPLVEYAAMYWVSHAGCEDVSLSLQDGIKTLFDPGRSHLAIWVWIYDPIAPWLRSVRPERVSQPIGTALHYAARCDLGTMVKSLVSEHSQDVNAHSLSDGDNSTPLHLASIWGHAEVARVLLENDADATAQEKYGRTPLHLASASGRVEVTHILLDHGSDVTAQDKIRQTPLHAAAYSGHMEVVRVLLEHGADVIAQDMRGWTPLHQASSEGHAEVAHFLLKHGADVGAQDKDGWTPLHRASYKGHAEAAHTLLEHGIDVAIQGKVELTPLHLASEEGHVEVARVLLKHGADVTARGKYGWTPLHRASDWGHVEAARVLLEHRADVAAQDIRGWTPLHWASSKGHAEVASVLLDHGANATAQDGDGWTPLYRASKGGRAKAARILLEHGACATARDQRGSSLLHWVSYWGHVEVVRVLLEYSVDATARDEDGWTPLHSASDGGHIEVALTLLEHGVDATAQDKDGWTPLHRASDMGRVEVARILLEHSVDATVQDKHGWTSLHRAADQGHAAVARILLEHDADVTTQDKDGWTPLHRSSDQGHVEVTSVLLKHNADVMARDEHGWTPLHRASRTGRVELVRTLLEHGADATARDKHEWTPLHRASDWGCVNIARVLLEHGVGATAHDEHGWTPLHRASRGGHVEVVRVLLENGADVAAQTKRGWTPLRWALQRGHMDVARVLHQYGADMDSYKDVDWVPSQETSVAQRRCIIQ